MFEIIKIKNRLSKSNYLLLSSSTLALLGCGGGSSSSKKDSTPASSSFGLTNDIFVDSMTHGVKWNFEDLQSYGYAIAGSNDGIRFGEIEVIKNVFDDVMASFHSYTGVNFEYKGEYTTPISAYDSGNEFVVTLDGDGNGQIFYAFSSAAAIGGPPILGAELGLGHDFPGNVIINYDHWYVQDAYTKSTADGSSFKNLLLHEYGHVFGVKHPHDDGGNGRPEFGTYGGLSSAFDNDLYTVMSYNDTHGGDNDLAKYDPSTYMVLDVLTLQYLYGKNLNFNSGDTNHLIENNNSFRSIWDPEGENTVDISNSKTDWYISLPWFVWSDLSNEPTGWAATYDNPSLDIPSDLVWLIGDFDNVNGGSGNDTIAGNSFDNHLSGGDGSDSIEGWEGNDTLTGGKGNDTFYYAVGWDEDRITDFDPSTDTIVLLDEFLEPIDLNRVKIEVIDESTYFQLSENSILAVDNFDYSADQSVLNDAELKSAENTDRATEDATSDQTNTSTETETNESMDSADTIEMGKAITGQLSSSSDFDVFKFDVAQASTLRLSFDVPTSSTYNLYFIASVFDAAGNFLSSKQVGLDTVFSTALNAAGTYYIQIEDSTFFDGGQYTLTGSLTDGTSGYETETNNSIQTADSITSGSVTKGQLWWQTDTDYYKISTSSASTISIDFDAPTNSSYNDYFNVSLLNASGAILASQDTGKDISLDTGVDSAGDYFILIQDSTFYTDLDYEISVSVDATDQTNTSTETETNESMDSADTIEMGKAITGQLSSSSDFDVFKFDVAQASTLRLSFDVPTSSTYNLYFIASVFDAAGNFLSSKQVGLDTVFSTALNAAGTYYIQIEDSTFFDGGQYTLTGSLTDGTSGYETETNNSIQTADSITSGSVTKGQLWWQTDTDYYKISTSSASTISIDFDAPTNSSYNDYFNVSLLNASGAILASQDTGKDISLDTGVDSAGDYFILIQDSTFYTDLDYEISVSVDATDQTNTSTETETNESMDSADTIEMGKAITGQLSSSSDFDVFKFDVAQASTLRLSFDAPTNSSYNDYFTSAVLDAAGNTLSSHQGGSDITFSTALNAAGTYYIQITDSTFHDSGQYSITASLTSGTSGVETETNDSIGTADVMSSGGSTKGQIRSNSDTDYYKISTNGASTISIDFDAPTNSSYNDYFNVSLLNASGTILASQDTGKDISFDTSVDSAGDYFVLIQDSTFLSTDEYSVSAFIA